MTYLNGKDILPEELFMQVQEYCAGELIYIPKKDGTRQNWGNSTGIRKELKELTEEFHLSVYSLKKILYH